MSLQPAPFHADVADGPDGAQAWWLTCADGTRIRTGAWPEGPKGTVLMFPGRTEYVEKYGRTARAFAARGFGMIALDYRGQGLSDRPAHRRDMGHVVSFEEYRRDVAALRDALPRIGHAGPYFVIGHSMGGAIALRALHDGLPVAGAGFTGPMWGIRMTPLLRMISTVLLGFSGPLGLSRKFVLTKGPVERLRFDGNVLTGDREMFDYMVAQTDAHPELALGGPSYMWVRAALQEARALMEMPAPALPALCYVGAGETIVEIDTARARMARWPGGQFKLVDGARHEVLMEAPAVRNSVHDGFAALFESATAGGDSAERKALG